YEYCRADQIRKSDKADPGKPIPAEESPGLSIICLWY
ncbi:unnamed protein product, partial [marine sediment metagenome]